MTNRIAALVLVASLAASALAGPAQRPTNPPRPVVNVNAATVAQVAYLPGVGAQLAARIVGGRPYASVGELDKVKGIGARKLEAMTPYVVLSGATTAVAKIDGRRTK